MIRVGIAGWDYPDWNGVVYPQPRPRGFDPLSFVSEIFDTVEVNATFYRIPAPSAAASWVRRTASRPNFRFTVKLPRSFTHAGVRVPGTVDPTTNLDEDEARFRAAIAPLLGADRLGAILVQFPQSFHAMPHERMVLEAILDRFSGLPLVAELRHAGWGSTETAALLRSRGVGFCNIDQPALASTLRPTSLVTGPIAYVRLHGRNASAWFREGAGRDLRYDYLYSVRELEPWIDSIRTIAEEGSDTFAITNNHFRGKGAVNALQIKAALEGGLITVPDPLLAAYPVLAPIAKPPGDRLPF